MDPQYLVGLEALLVIGVVFGLGVWQLVSLRREQRRDREAKERKQQEQKGPPAP